MHNISVKFCGCFSFVTWWKDSLKKLNRPQYGGETHCHGCNKIIPTWNLFLALLVFLLTGEYNQAPLLHLCSPFALCADTCTCVGGFISILLLATFFCWSLAALHTRFLSNAACMLVCPSSSWVPLAFLYPKSHCFIRCTCWPHCHSVKYLAIWKVCLRSTPARQGGVLQFSNWGTEKQLFQGHAGSLFQSRELDPLLKLLALDQPF